MDFWLITTLIAIWIFLSATILVSVCMLSSRLSRAEELRASGKGHEFATSTHREPAPAPSRTHGSTGDMLELPAGLGNR